MSVASRGSGWREHVVFLGRFLRSPRQIGAIAPSSPTLAEAMVDTFALDRAATIVELGPGTGALTAALVARAAPRVRILAIDREPAFVQRLCDRWPRLECVCDSAVELPRIAAERALGPVDCILSGLPFASLPAATMTRILDGIEETLRPGGTFTTFQYVHAYALPPAISFRREIHARMGSTPSRKMVVWNLPPAYVLSWTRTIHSSTGSTPRR